MERTVRSVVSNRAASRALYKGSRQFFSAKCAKAEQEELDQILAEADQHRPRTRGDCVDGERPCPYVSCKYHLFVDVYNVEKSDDKYTVLRLNRSAKYPWEMRDTCALDVADRGAIYRLRHGNNYPGHTLEEIALLLGLTREMVRLIEKSGLSKLLGFAKEACGDQW